MSPWRVVVLVVAVSFVAGARSVSPAAAYSPSLVTSITDWGVPTPNQHDSPDRDADGSGIDVFGNEVDEAVCDYRVDVRGDLYERHSPDTEVPRLRPPIG
jgi:hypothetical protein